MGTCRLRHRVVWLGFQGMDKVGKLHRILDEEDRNVVADDVEVAFVGVELGGEPSHVTGRVDGSTLASNSREANKNWRLLARLAQEGSPRERRQRLVALEKAVSG